MFIDLTGQKFNHLTAKYYDNQYINSKGKRVSVWWCECDCGNPELVPVTATHLKTGHTKSCGCFNLQRKIERIQEYNKTKQSNRYDLSGEYGVGYDCKNEEFWFDLEDYDLIKDYTWNVYYDKDGRADVKAHDKNNEIIRMSRLIMNCPDDKVVDHIHCSTTRHDNRKSNLRITDNLHNSLNSGIQTNNTSGTTGVHWNKQSQKWLSFITVNKERIRLGLFEKYEEAVRVRKEAEDKYFGEFSYKNSQVL